MAEQNKGKTAEALPRELISTFARTNLGNDSETGSGNGLPVFLMAKRDSRGSFTERCSGGVLRELPEYPHEDKICLVTSGLSDINNSTYMKDYSLFFLRSNADQNKAKRKKWKKIKSSKEVSVVNRPGRPIFIPAKKSRSLKNYRQYSVTVMTDEDRRRARLECQIVLGNWRSFEVRKYELEYHNDVYELNLGNGVFCKTLTQLKEQDRDFHPYGSVILEKESGTAVGVLSFVEDEICPLFFEPKPVDDSVTSENSSDKYTGHEEPDDNIFEERPPDQESHTTENNLYDGSDTETFEERPPYQEEPPGQAGPRGGTNGSNEEPPGQAGLGDGVNGSNEEPPGQAGPRDGGNGSNGESPGQAGLGDGGNRSNVPPGQAGLGGGVSGSNGEPPGQAGPHYGGNGSNGEPPGQAGPFDGGNGSNGEPPGQAGLGYGGNGSNGVPPGQAVPHGGGNGSNGTPGQLPKYDITISGNPRNMMIGDNNTLNEEAPPRNAATQDQPVRHNPENTNASQEPDGTPGQLSKYKVKIIGNPRNLMIGDNNRLDTRAPTRNVPPSAPDGVSGGETTQSNGDSSSG